jgi:peptidoglycan/LPS O-acetylase OafA/YrhL
MQKNTNKLLHLVSIRGLAAWLVVFFHSIALLHSAMPQLPPSLFRLIGHGYLAVDFFFVLSGFIIFINYHEKFGAHFYHNAKTFYWNRISRIYPVHIVMLFAYLLLCVAFRYASASRALPAEFTAASFWQSALLIHAWSGSPTSWNVPSWSISAEWFVYLLFPFVAVFFQTRIRRLLAHFLAAAAILVTLCAIYSALGIDSLGLATTTTPLVRAFFEFLMGAVAGSLFIHHAALLNRSHLAVALLIAAVGTVVFFFDFPNYATVPLLFFLVVVFLSVDTSWLARMLSNKVLVYIGEISYSTYMVHYFVYDVLKAGWVKDGQQVSLVPLIASFLAVLLLSMLMYKFVEIPAQNYLRSGVLKNRREPLRFRL